MARQADEKALTSGLGTGWPCQAHYTGVSTVRLPSTSVEPSDCHSTLAELRPADVAAILVSGEETNTPRLMMLQE